MQQIQTAKDVHRLFVEEKGVWQPWDWSYVDQGRKRCALYCEETHTLTFPMQAYPQSCMQQQALNVKVFLHTLQSSLLIKDKTPVFTKRTQARISTITTLGNTLQNVSKESDDHYITRQQHRYSHHERICSKQDLEQILLDQFLDILQVKVIKEAQNIKVFVLWNDSMNFKQSNYQKNKEVLQVLQRKLACIANTHTISVQQPVHVLLYITVYLMNDDMDVDGKIKKTIRQYLHMRQGKEDGKGWKLGEYPKNGELCMYLQKVFPETRFYSCEIRGMIQNRKQECIYPIDTVRGIKEGVIIPYTIRMKRKEEGV